MSDNLEPAAEPASDPAPAEALGEVPEALDAPEVARTVTIHCAVPGGLRVQLGGADVVLAGVMAGLPAADVDAWIAENADYAPVAAGLISIASREG